MTAPAMNTATHPALARLLNRCEVDGNGCWVWQGCLHVKGYGRIMWNRNVRMTHRVAYEGIVGPIPSGLQLDHLCRNRACCNPAHLEPVDNRTNSLRGVGPTAANAAMTHCKRGHEFDAENTRHYRGTRICRACRQAYARERRSDAAA